jgi:hypothetical protein
VLEKGIEADISKKDVKQHPQKNKSMKEKDDSYLAIGCRMLLNFACMEFLSSTFLAPFSFRTRSSLGRLKAIVWTDFLASPAKSR